MCPYSFPVMVLDSKSQKGLICPGTVFLWAPCLKWSFVTMVMRKSFAANEVYTVESYLQSCS